MLRLRRAPGPTWLASYRQTYLPYFLEKVGACKEARDIDLNNTITTTATNLAICAPYFATNKGLSPLDRCIQGLIQLLYFNWSPQSLTIRDVLSHLLFLLLPLTSSSLTPSSPTPSSFTSSTIVIEKVLEL